MAANEPKLLEWLTRLGAWRGNRRQAGLLGAALLAALGVPEAASARRKKRKPQRDRAGSERLLHGGPCGGIAGIPCPGGFTCVDDPDDDCDPANGGADCGGICVRKRKDPCARIRCAAGTVCCPKCGGLCIPPDVPCTKERCLPTPCNEEVCRPGEYCCNRSCSHCVPLGDACTREVCPPPDPGQPCGKNACGEGEFCCNPSCGECAPIGGACTARFCGPTKGEPCGKTVCRHGQVCCNASCGVCTPPGMACIMIACEEDA